MSNSGAARSGTEAGANDAPPIPGEFDEREIRAALKKSLEKQNNDPDAGVYRQILVDQGLDPAKIPGQTFVTKVFEAYKRYPKKAVVTGNSHFRVAERPELPGRRYRVTGWP